MKSVKSKGPPGILCDNINVSKQSFHIHKAEKKSCVPR